MPWRDPKQRAAIAAEMRRKGKTEEEIAAFFRAHGHGGEGEKKPRRLRDRVKR
jgi:anthranilate phosphoribosyltransferase